MLKEILEKKKKNLRSPVVQEELKVAIEAFITHRIRTLFASNLFTIHSIHKDELVEDTDIKTTRVLQLLFAFSYSCLVGQSSVNRIMFGVPIDASDSLVDKTFEEVSQVVRPQNVETTRREATSIFDKYVGVIKDINSNLELDHLKILEEFDQICTDHFVGEPRIALSLAGFLFESTLIVYTRMAATLLFRALPDASTSSIKEMFKRLYLKSKVKQMKVVNKQFDSLIITDDPYISDTIFSESLASESEGDSTGHKEIFTSNTQEEERISRFCQEGILKRCDISTAKIIPSEIIESFENLSKPLNIRFRIIMGKNTIQKHMLN